MFRNTFQIENFKNPPEKVRLMFQAVTDLLAENANISTLKVKDITDRAGIGKGTAYEYFSSREEMIIMALFYEYGKKIGELEKLVKDAVDFREKMFLLLGWLHAHRKYHMTFVHMVRMSIGNEDLCESLKDRISPEIFAQMRSFMIGEGDRLLEQGYSEKVFTEKDPVKRRMAFAAMLFQVVLTFGEKQQISFFDMEFDAVCSFAYDSFVKALS